MKAKLYEVVKIKAQGNIIGSDFRVYGDLYREE